MPLHIEQLTSEVTVMDGNLLNPAQLEALAQMVIKKLGEKAREAERKQNATQLRHQAGAPLEA
jgi:hypothetical protein